MNNPHACPNAERLQALLEGVLSNDEHTSLARHLEACVACRQRLEELAGGVGETMREAIAPLVQDDQCSDALNQVMSNLKAESAEWTQVPQCSQGGPPSLEFLRASDNRRHLGRLAGYEVLEMIGRGGMGTVLKARDPKLERLVAIKVLNPELSSSGQARARFLREARSAAAVTHEHVVTIHAVDDSAEVPFLVMEYIVGVSLEDRIQRSGQLQLEEVLRIGMQIASGLAAAHVQGLVHRDIKPSNILLENGVERVKITDFGLARVAHEAQLTQSNTVAGTPQYMSPEQARGEPVDHRTDLFSLGCVMYAMCVGRSPFRAETPTGAIHRVCNDVPRPIRQLNPDIPDWLVEIIDRMLEKRRDDRFQTASEVAELLGQYLAHVQQPSRMRLPRAHRAFFTRRRGWPVLWPAAAAFSGIAATVLTIIGVNAFWSRQDGPVPPPPPARFHRLDIQAKANRLLDEGTDRPGNNLADIGPGRLETDGVPFDVGERYIQLGGSYVEDCPDSIQGIPVNRRVAKVHFLHGTGHTFGILGQEVAAYTFRYVDGSSVTMPVITGRHLREWWLPKGATHLATRATAAWHGTNQVTPDETEIFVYHCVWQNPHPEKTIESIDLTRSQLERPSMFCLAITCDSDSRPLPPESGLLAVRLGEFLGSGRCSVVISESRDPVIRGKGLIERLLPTGRHSVEIRDGAKAVRRGTIQVEAGCVTYLEFDAPQSFIPFPAGQPGCVEQLTGQPWCIRDAALSADGAHLATAAGNGTVILWRQDQGIWKTRLILPAQDNPYVTVAFSPNGQSCVTGNANGLLQVWNTASGQLVATLRHDAAKVTTAVYSPDGRYLAAGFDDGTAVIWNAASHSEVHRMRVGMGAVNDIAFSPKITLCAFCTEDDEAVKLWHVDSWSQARVLAGHTDAVKGIAFHPDRELLASVSRDTTLKVWDAETGELARNIIHPQDLKAVAFDPSGKYIATGGSAHGVTIVDVDSGDVIHDFHAHWAGINALCFTCDGQRLITASDDNTARVWILKELPSSTANKQGGPEPLAKFNAHVDWAMCVTISRSGELLAAAGHWPIDLGVWNLKDLSRVARLSIQENGEGFVLQDSLGFGANNDLFTCLSLKVKPRIARWDVRKRVQEEVQPGSISANKDITMGMIALSEDASILVVSSNNENAISCMNPETRQTLWTRESRYGRPFAPAISHDSKMIAIGTESGQVLLLDSKTGSEIHESLSVGSQTIWSVRFAACGLLAAVGEDGVIGLWDVPSFTRIELPHVHQEELYATAFSPDGQILVTAGGYTAADPDPWNHNGEICLWNVQKRELLAKYFAHYGCVTSVAFTPDGQTLATTGRDGKVCLWDVDAILEFGIAP